MPKAIPFLFLVLSSFCLCPFAFALPQQHEAWYQDNDAYRTMYDRYEIGLQRAYDALPEESYKILEKENDAAIDESVKHAEPAGKNAALACAQALAERILIMEEMVSNADSERVAGTPNPLEGFYRLIGRQGDDGYLTISRDGNTLIRFLSSVEKFFSSNFFSRMKSPSKLTPEPKAPLFLKASGSTMVAVSP